MARPASSQPNTQCGRHRETDGVVYLPIDALSGAHSVRVNGEDAAHVRRLAALDEGALPPVVVHRTTMRVVDGLHRLRAAQLRGASHIDARFVDGDDLDVTVSAVLANTDHDGLPLTRADRKSAVTHMLSLRPQWSDRRVAALAGVAPRTVVEVRDRLGGGDEVRVGRDGRQRPTDGARRRALVRELLLDHPHLSLREAARVVGISPETVRAVRADMKATVDRPAAPQVGTDVGRPERAAAHDTRAAIPQTDCVPLLRWLRNDPALRSTQGGRGLLRLLHLQVQLRTSWAGLIRHVPPHCHSILAALARQNAMGWRALAEEFERDLAS